MPPAVVKAAYKQQQDNDSVTEIIEIKNRGHVRFLHNAPAGDPADLTATRMSSCSPTEPAPRAASAARMRR